jgi:hypothetical protein
MKGDFSRSVHELDATVVNRFAGVLHQQGRVWLDSDWNEDIYDRLHLLQQETLDIIGGCGAPVPGTGFQISPNPDPTKPDDFLIAAGRYYVDGILCQLANDMSYLTQPDYPNAAPVQMPVQGSNLQALIYLEVWQRLITYLEDPTLREIALGGPDTATRIETVAQVKVLIPSPASSDNGGDGSQELTCANAPLPAAGQGTLTTLQPTNLQPDDLCRLPDPANYTGRDNHLYRVEIHDGGDVLGGSAGFAFSNQPLAQDAPAGSVTLVLQNALSSDQAGALTRSGLVTVADSTGQMETVAITDIDSTNTTVSLAQGLVGSYTVANDAAITGGVARFKWSRDNASFVVAVTDIGDRQTLTVASLGRDQATVLRQGDIVEISDDVSDLGPASGFLTYLTDNPDPDLLTVPLASPLPPQFQVNPNVDYHLKLRRWDGLGWANATFDPAATPAMDLGDGVHIQFGGSDLRAGDYWQFAARSADGSVEALTNAPPTGILRHHCPLAIANWSYTTLYNLATVRAACDQANINGGVFTAIQNQLQQSEQTSWDAATIEAAAQSAGATAEQIQVLDQALTGLQGQGESQLTLTVTDCRQTFNPLTQCPCGDCTVTVAPGDSLSAAFDQIGAEGGTICLLPGMYALSETVTVMGKPNLTVRGAGAATVITAPTAVVLQFQNCDHLTLRDLMVSNVQATGTTSQGTSAAGEQATGAAGQGAAAATNLLPLLPGAITFEDCQAVSMTGCTAACAGSAGELPNFGVAFIGQPVPAPGAAAGPTAAPAARSARRADLQSRLQQLLKFRPETVATRARRVPPPAPTGPAAAGGPQLAPGLAGRPASIAPTRTTGAVAAPLRAAAAAPGLAVDFTVRDCRFYVGAGTDGGGAGGLLVSDSAGVAIEDNWILPLAFAQVLGLGEAGGSAISNQQATYGLALLDTDTVTIANNIAVLLTAAALLATSQNMVLHGNTFRGNWGLFVSDTTTMRQTTLEVSDNTIVANSGPAALIIGGVGSEVILTGNWFSGVPVAAGLAAVAEITATTAIASGNDFRTGIITDTKLFSNAVTIVAHMITYQGNYSLCTSLPSKANVVLFDGNDGSAGAVPGTITAVGNTCLEPPPSESTAISKRLQELGQQEGKLVTQFLTKPDFTYQEFQKETPVQEWQVLMREFSDLIQKEQISLLAVAGVAVTGLNILSYQLWRVGLGSDQGSVSGVAITGIA